MDNLVPLSSNKRHQKVLTKTGSRSETIDLGKSWCLTTISTNNSATLAAVKLAGPEMDIFGKMIHHDKNSTHPSRNG